MIIIRRYDAFYSETGENSEQKRIRLSLCKKRAETKSARFFRIYSIAVSATAQMKNTTAPAAVILLRIVS